MKKLHVFLKLLLLSPSLLLAYGVGILDARNAVYLRLDSSVVDVSVQSQISVTTTTQYFTNTHATAPVKYAFPMGEQASATQLRWKTSGGWNTASVSGNAQDTSLPGGAPNANLSTYLGGTPLYFSIPDSLPAGSTLAVELTYVELLPYAFGSVSYSYPGDYHLIDPGSIGVQRFNFELYSPRTIDSIKVTSGQSVDVLLNDGNDAVTASTLYETPAAANYSVRYTLDENQLGLFAYSTWLPDSLTPDTLGGYLTFIAEPDPGHTTATIAKVFTLIVDCSGSMAGTKITQARDAASYIVQNLNAGDRFNIINFATNVSSFRPGHVAYTASSRDSALAYIAQFAATSSTNISGAFDVAVPQFKYANDSTANIVIFLTDGQPTVGITNIQALTNHIDSLINATETDVNLFSFGIGTDANQQLLTLIASNNSGLAAFLGNDELYSRITDFYNTIRNPVLLHSHVSFDPPVVNEVYPDSLPNLYKGQQMIVTGRYKTACSVRITLSGTAFGQPVSYTYDIDLATEPVNGYEFLPKVWAKKKIESLLIQYYALNSTSTEAMALRAEIVALSQAYGVISPLTSFTSSPVLEIEKATQGKISPASSAFEFLSARSLNSLATIHLRLNINYSGSLEIRIYDLHGKIVKTLILMAHGRGDYEVTWSGQGSNGFTLPNGTYFCAMELGNTVHVTRIILSN